LIIFISEIAACNSVTASKDVDGFSSVNLGKLVQGSTIENGGFIPCTALAVAEIVKVILSRIEYCLGYNAIRMFSLSLLRLIILGPQRDYVQ